MVDPGPERRKCGVCGRRITPQTTRLGFNCGDDRGAFYFCKKCLPEESAEIVFRHYERGIILGDSDSN